MPRVSFPYDPASLRKHSAPFTVFDRKFFKLLNFTVIKFRHGNFRRRFQPKIRAFVVKKVILEFR